MAGSRSSVVLIGLFMLAGCVPPASLVRGGGATPAPVTAVPAAAVAPAVAEAPVATVTPPAPVPEPEAARELRLAAETQQIEAAVTTPAPPAWDIEVAPYESHARVEYFISRFSGAMKPTFEVALARQTRFAPMIHERLRAAGLPEDMIYLPLIESWYDTHAYSRAAAVGMWQFMTTTAKGVGMRVDWWVDERRDPVRAAGLPEDMIYLPLIESWYDTHAYSRAAAVGMWQFMTTTAKGVGMRVDWWVDERRDPVRATDGAVRYLTELREDFGSIYLAAAAYNGGSGRVSRGLATHAAALEGRQGEDLFFALAEQKALRTETSDYVPKLIAAALVGKDPLRYTLNVRAVEPFTWDSVTVPPATPLAAVARGLDVPLDTLLDYNPQILRGMTPPAGPSVWLRVPVGTTEGFLERFTTLSEAERTGVKRVVTREGDFITKIARANGLTAKQLNAYNPQATRLKNGNLHAGQRILVPRLDVVRASREVPDPKIERYGSSASAVHVVKRGESLGVIARRNGTSVAALKRLNRLRSDAIRIGQRLRVR